ncbi:hypothetical protein NL676_015523 [Syzygium grande]|nr:hypothetical protein NL676_015523 [Syzygium grande]
MRRQITLCFQNTNSGVYILPSPLKPPEAPACELGTCRHRVGPFAKRRGGIDRLTSGLTSLNGSDDDGGQDSIFGSGAGKVGAPAGNDCSPP